MSNKKIIIHSKFNVWNTEDQTQKTKEWINNRMKVFMSYTAKSLKAQTSQNFDALIVYNNDTKDEVMSALSRYPILPNNIHFIREKDQDTVIKSLISGYDTFYLARIDSDDMYHKNHVHHLHNYIPKEDTQVLIFQNGYMYNSKTGELGTYTRKSPPFFSLIYDTKEYLDGFRYKYKGHREVQQKLKQEFVGYRNFCVVAHGHNTTTAFAFKNGDHVIKDKKVARRILKDFTEKDTLLKKTKYILPL